MSRSFCIQQRVSTCQTFLCRGLMSTVVTCRLGAYLALLLLVRVAVLAPLCSRTLPRCYSYVQLFLLLHACVPCRAATRTCSCSCSSMLVYLALLLLVSPAVPLLSLLLQYNTRLLNIFYQIHLLITLLLLLFNYLAFNYILCVFGIFSNYHKIMIFLFSI